MFKLSHPPSPLSSLSPALFYSWNDRMNRACKCNPFGEVCERDYTLFFIQTGNGSEIKVISKTFTLISLHCYLHRI